MKQFELSRQPQRHGDTLTRFHVLDSARSTVGIVSVPTSQADDLQRHWLGDGGATQPQASAAPGLPASGKTKGNALAAALEANKRPGSLPPAPASKANPVVNAMLAAAKKNRLSQAAILRGC